MPSTAEPSNSAAAGTSASAAAKPASVAPSTGGADAKKNDGGKKKILVRTPDLFRLSSEDKEYFLDHFATTWAPKAISKQVTTWQRSARTLSKKSSSTSAPHPDIARLTRNAELLPRVAPRAVARLVWDHYVHRRSAPLTPEDLGGLTGDEATRAGDLARSFATTKEAAAGVEKLNTMVKFKAKHVQRVKRAKMFNEQEKKKAEEEAEKEREEQRAKFAAENGSDSSSDSDSDSSDDSSDSSSDEDDDDDDDDEDGSSDGDADDNNDDADAVLAKAQRRMALKEAAREAKAAAKAAAKIEKAEKKAAKAAAKAKDGSTDAKKSDKSKAAVAAPARVRLEQEQYQKERKERASLAAAYAHLPPGTVIRAVVQGTSDFGVFLVTVVGAHALKAMVHISEAAKRGGSHASKEVTPADLKRTYAPGDRVSAVVIDTDLAAQKVRLSFKRERFPPGVFHQHVSARALAQRERAKKAAEKSGGRARASDKAKAAVGTVDDGTQDIYVGSLKAAAAAEGDDDDEEEDEPPMRRFRKSLDLLTRLQGGGSSKSGKKNKLGQRNRRTLAALFFGLDPKDIEGKIRREQKKEQRRREALAEMGEDVPSAPIKFVTDFAGGVRVAAPAGEEPSSSRRDEKTEKVENRSQKRARMFAEAAAAAAAGKKDGNDVIFVPPPAAPARVPIPAPAPTPAPAPAAAASSASKRSAPSSSSSSGSSAPRPVSSNVAAQQAKRLQQPAAAKPPVPEAEMHPSWAAKQKQSQLVAFEGKRMKF